MPSRGVNKVILVGNVGNDPDVRTTGNDISVANFSLATTERWTSSEGKAQSRTEWHRITCWRKLAELVQEYVTKGSSLYVEGKLQTRKWEDDAGNTRYTTEVVADQMVFLGDSGSSSKEDTSTGEEGSDDLPF